MSTSTPSQFPFKDTPGQVLVEVIAFQDGDPRFQTVDENGQPRNQGRSLEYMRKIFKGHEGSLTDPLVGQTHHISLLPWMDADEQQIFIRVRFQFMHA